MINYYNRFEQIYEVDYWHKSTETQAPMITIADQDIFAGQFVLLTCHSSSSEYTAKTRCFLQRV